MKITLRLDSEQVREIDELRGIVSRTAWIAAVLSRTTKGLERATVRREAHLEQPKSG